jgi:hypothetical protein
MASAPLPATASPSVALPTTETAISSVSAVIADDNDEQHPRVPTMEEHEATRKARRAELLAKKRNEEASRDKARKEREVAAAQIAQAQKAAQGDVARVQLVEQRGGDVLVLKSHPTAGRKIMTAVNAALTMGGPMIGITGDNVVLIRAAVRKTLVAADEFYQHSLLMGWISLYVMMSYIFPAHHMYILMTLANALSVFLSGIAWMRPRWLPQQLNRFLFPLRDLLHPDDRTTQSPVFQALFLVYTGIVNWLTLTQVGGTLSCALASACFVSPFPPRERLANSPSWCVAFARTRAPFNPHK